MLKGIQYQKNQMPPKEKADELFKRMGQNALICAGEVIAALKKIFGDNPGITLSDIVYWQDVEGELKKNLII